MKTWYRQPGSAAGRPVRGGADLQGNPDQAVALRRRRLRHPMVAVARSLEQPRQRLWADGRMRGRRSRSVPTSRSRSRPTTSATPSSTSRAPFASIGSARSGFVGLVGVQSNQFPARARSRPCSSAPPGVPVVIGGFHVERLPLDAAGTAGRPAKRRSISASSCSPARAKAAWPTLLREIDGGTAKPIYNYLNDMPEMAAATLPILPRER